MKKVGILTFFFADNFGAVLQCFALKTYLNMNGIDVGVINYIPNYMRPLRSRVKRCFIKTIQQKKFELFRKSFLSISNDKGYDTIVVGSDQVWNPSLNGFDNNWIKPKIKFERLISYAASFGKKTLREKEKLYIMDNKDNLLRYDAISIREQDGKSILSDIGLTSELVCDPVFLLCDRMDVYTALANKSHLQLNTEYILVYALEKSKGIVMAVNEVRKQSGLQIVYMHPENIDFGLGDYFIKDVGPEDFIQLIKNSSAVITNSFHGLAFSLLYDKVVFVVGHSELSSRQKQLLDLIDPVSVISNDFYVKIESNKRKDDNLKKLIETSKEYINTYIK